MNVRSCQWIHLSDKCYGKDTEKYSHTSQWGHIVIKTDWQCGCAEPFSDGLLWHCWRHFAVICWLIGQNPNEEELDLFPDIRFVPALRETFEWTFWHQLLLSIFGFGAGADLFPPPSLAESERPSTHMATQANTQMSWMLLLPPSPSLGLLIHA